MTARTFVDTNVWVYAVDTADSTKQLRAQSVIETLDPSSTVVSAQVLNEFFVTVTRKLRVPLSHEDAATGVVAIAEMEVAPVTRALVLRAIDRTRASNVSLWDALIVETARAAACNVLLTEDLNAGQEFGDLLVRDPFAELDG